MAFPGMTQTEWVLSNVEAVRYDLPPEATAGTFHSIKDSKISGGP
jgi:hypothetical protein